MAKQVMKPRRTSRLPQTPDMDRRHKRTWIVVADGARARFFEPREDLRSLIAAGQPAMAAIRDGNDDSKTDEDDLIARVAEALDRACEAGRFDRLVLVAPPRSLGELRALLSTRVQKMVAHEVGKDLANASPAQLHAALADLLPSTALA